MRNYKLYFFIFFCLNVSLLWSEDEKQILSQMLNDIRVKNGLNPILIIDETAHLVAQRYAQELQWTDKLSHVNSKGQGSFDRYRLAEGTALKTAEILATGDSLSVVINAWLSSNEHLKAILDAQWTSWGIGMMKSTTGYIIVILFTNSLLEKIIYHYKDNHVHIQCWPRQPIDDPLFLQAGMQQQISLCNEWGYFTFDLMTKGPEYVMIFNARHQGDVLKLPLLTKFKS